MVRPRRMPRRTRRGICWRWLASRMTRAAARDSPPKTLMRPSMTAHMARRSKRLCRVHAVMVIFCQYNSTPLCIVMHFFTLKIIYRFCVGFVISPLVYMGSLVLLIVMVWIFSIGYRFIILRCGKMHFWYLFLDFNKRTHVARPVVRSINWLNAFRESAHCTCFVNSAHCTQKTFRLFFSAVFL